MSRQLSNLPTPPADAVEPAAQPPKPDLADASGPAAAQALKPRLKDLVKAARRLADTDTNHIDQPKRVHALRVSCRRAESCLNALGQSVAGTALQRLTKRVRRLRRACGRARDGDVHLSLVDALRDRLDGRRVSGLDAVRDLIVADRDTAVDRLCKAVADKKWRLIREASKEGLKELRGHDQGSFTALGASRIRLALGETQRLAAQDLAQAENMHELRIALKRLRYVCEFFDASLAPAFKTDIYPTFEEAQKRLGDVNDLATLVDRLDRYVARNTAKPAGSEPASPDHETQPDVVIRDAAESLAERFRAVCERRSAQALTWWKQSGAADAVDRVPALLVEPAQSSPRPVLAPPNGHSPGYTSAEPRVPALFHDDLDGASVGPARAAAPQRNLFLSGRRLGVIDIGSNSIRLLAVELIDERSWRVIVEERSMTRLAHGLADSGELCSEAVARSVEAITRFKYLADRAGVQTLRAFATAAVREARNRDEFLSLVKERADIAIELVSPDDEGKLTYRAVARVFDLTRGLTAVADMGGGSLEVVFSQDGVICENTSMPLGAVRVTEAFGGAQASSGPRFSEMRRHARRQIERCVRAHDVPPAILVGCGGTFTTMLTLAAAARGIIIDRNSPDLLKLGPVSRRELKDIVQRLRMMPLEQRLRVPGLPSDRADIILAGLIGIEQLVRHLGVSQVYAYPGGVREGLLLRMVDEELTSTATPLPEIELLRAVRSFAHRCHYEREHSEHVARLALSLLDQLRAHPAAMRGLPVDPDERLILEAAAVLHDVGIMVDYQGHHKHSHTIIRHADLTGLPPRLNQMIASVARYHRKAPPSLRHRAYALLTPQDRDTVARLSAILRVADGLDRAHRQLVLALHAAPQPGKLLLTVEGEGDLSSEIDASRNKCALLERELETRIEYAQAPHVSSNAVPQSSPLATQPPQAPADPEHADAQHISGDHTHNRHSSNGHLGHHPPATDLPIGR